MTDAPNTAILDAFFDDFPQKGKLLIVAHNHPDPDTIASAAALKEITEVMAKGTTTIAYGGIIGRAENANMVKYLKLELTPMDQVDVKKFDRIAMVDTQPQTGNNNLSEDFMPDLVIDHHPKSKASSKVRFLDIRLDYGATASILSEYMFKYDLSVDKNLATALLYAIKSETQDLGRETYKVDVECYRRLFPLANKKLLSKIIHSRVSREYFHHLQKAISNATVHGNAVITTLKEVNTPDMIPEIADMMMKMDGAAWAFSMGEYEGAIHLSIRTTNLQKDAGKIMKQLVRGKGTGGGHMQIAGGRILVPGKEAWEIHEIKEKMETKFLKAIGKEKQSKQPLVQTEV